MPRLYGASATGDGDTRRVARQASQIDVTVASAHGAEATVVIGDISSHGCSIGLTADWLRLGAFVWLTADDEAAVVGIVRWIRDATAGIEFVRPLAPGSHGLAGLIADG